MIQGRVTAAAERYSQEQLPFQTRPFPGRTVPPHVPPHLVGTAHESFHFQGWRQGTVLPDQEFLAAPTTLGEWLYCHPHSTDEKTKA